MSHPTSKLIAGVAALTCAGLAALDLSLWRQRETAPRIENLQLALQDEDLRRQVVELLQAGTPGFYDSHNDPEVGRSLQPGEHLKNGVEITVNRFGLREREFEVPKPEGLVRVVLLGDSFVFGNEVHQDQRFGVVLEEALRSRCVGPAPELEVLHFGVGSWNLLGECAFLRRQLSLVDPDLVIHLTVGNDVDDASASRGFGVMSKFSARYRERTDSLVKVSHPRHELNAGGSNHLLHELDAESRTRFDEISRELGRLSRAVERRGRYLFVVHMSTEASAARSLARELRPEQVVLFPSTLHDDTSLWVSAGDSHWNRRGHELAAQMLYTRIRADGLLDLELAPWPEAEQTAAAYLPLGVQEALLPRPNPIWTQEARVDASLDASDMSAEGSHVYAGIDRAGLVSPYASLTLLRAGRTLRLLGECLPRPELDGATVRVEVEQVPVGEFRLEAGRPIDLEFDVSAPDGDYVNVRLVADDYAYAGESLQHCVVFQLKRIWIE